MFTSDCEELFLHIEVITQKSPAKSAHVDILISINVKDNLFTICSVGCNEVKDVTKEDRPGVLVITKAFKVMCLLR